MKSSNQIDSPFQHLNPRPFFRLTAHPKSKLSTQKAFAFSSPRDEIFVTNCRLPFYRPEDLKSAELGVYHKHSNPAF